MKALPKNWQELPQVEVVWMDAAGNLAHEGTLNDPDTAKTFGGLEECRDMGYLIRRNKRELVLASGLVISEQIFRASTTIPAGWVKEVIVLSRRPAGAAAEPPPKEAT